MMKLLIADDEIDTSNAIRRLIPWNEHGIELCSEAINGQEAITIIEQERPDAALLDIRMPLVDGLGVARYIHYHHPNISVVILSGYDEFAYAQSAIKYGVSDYLLKPCRMDDILNSILSCREKLYFPEQATSTLSYHNKLEETELFIFDIKKKYLLDVLRSSKKHDIERCLKELFTVFYEKKYTKQLVLNYLLSLITDIAKFCSDCSLPTPSSIFQLMDIHILSNFSSLKDLESSILDLLLQICAELEIKSQKSLPVQAAISYIQDNYQDDLDLNFLAEQVHVTPAYLSSLFKIHTGTNFLDYLTNYRIEKACQLLKTTTLKTYEIAWQTGFKDEKYFSTVFKKWTGIPPSKYRKLYTSRK